MVFGLFRKKEVTALDALITSIYGPHPPRKTADFTQAARLAHESLLQGRVPFSDVRALTEELNSGPIPYSTCDLAASVAMNFFKRDELHRVLGEAQLLARMQMLEWVKENKLNRQIAISFENVLYERFKPKAPAQSTSAKTDPFTEYLRAVIDQTQKKSLEGNYVPEKYNEVLGLVKTLDARRNSDAMMRWCYDLCNGVCKKGTSIDQASDLLLLFHWENYMEYSTGIRPDVTKSP